MGKAFQRLLGAALGVLLSASGCAIVADRGNHGPHVGAAQAGGSDGIKSDLSKVGIPPLGQATAPSSGGSSVAPAVAYQSQLDQGKVQQTAGVLSDSAKAIEQGANKVSQSLKPPLPPVVPADDPTSVFTKSKPSPELYVAMARYHEQNGQAAPAEQAYQRALKMSPKHLGVLLNYARFKDRQGQRAEALDLYLKAAKLHPNESSVHNDLGLFYARQGKNKEAIECYQRAVQLQPQRPLYRHNIAIALVDSGQPERAMEHLAAVNNEADTCYKMGYLLQKKGQLAEAATYFDRAVQVNPSMEAAKIWLGHVRRQLGSVERVARRPAPPEVPASPQGPTARRDPPARGDLPAPPGARLPRGQPLEPPPPPATDRSVPRVGPRAAPSEAPGPGKRPGPSTPQRLPLPGPWEEKRMFDVPAAEEPPLPPPTRSGAVGEKKEAIVGDLGEMPPLPDDLLSDLGPPDPPPAASGQTASKGTRPARLPAPETPKPGSASKRQPPEAPPGQPAAGTSATRG